MVSDCVNAVCHYHSCYFPNSKLGRGAPADTQQCGASSLPQAVSCPANFTAPL